MPQRDDEVPFFDYVTEGLELVTSDPSPLSGFGGPGDLNRFAGPHHATYSDNQPTAARVHERSTPAFSYSTTVSAARGGFAPVNVVSYDNPQLFPDSTPTTTTYQARQTISPSPTYFQSGLEWQSSPASDLLYASEDSSVVSASSNVNAFGYVSQASGQDPYMGDYASPVASQEAAVMDPNLYWAGDSPMGGDIGPSFSNPGSNLASPIIPVYGSLSRTPEGGISDSDGDAAAVTAYGGTISLGPAQQGQVPNEGGNAPPRKRAKNSPEKSISASALDALSGYRKPATVPLLAPKAGGSSDIGGSGSGSGGASTGTGTTVHKSKLRSASRTSKNIVTRPSETAEERKTRNSHNLVEKQYRNRLNAHFENLLNALPDSIRSPGGSGGDSDGIEGGGGAASVDLGERRLSKAEVLDMSRRYIQSLEKERDKLEREREELQGDMARLRSAYERGGRGGVGSSAGGGGSLSGS
ncbi:allergen Fus c 3 [Naviculisporaceae sp. PSN 640]